MSPTFPCTGETDAVEFWRYSPTRAPSWCFQPVPRLPIAIVVEVEGLKKSKVSKRRVAMGEKDDQSCRRATGQKTQKSLKSGTKRSRRRRRGRGNWEEVIPARRERNIYRRLKLKPLLNLGYIALRPGLARGQAEGHARSMSVQKVNTMVQHSPADDP